jgi:hypothetical protein
MTEEFGPFETSEEAGLAAEIDDALHGGREPLIFRPESGVCRHCGERIMKFQFKEGEQWWHATVNAVSPTYRRCGADPAEPYAEPLP